MDSEGVIEALLDYVRAAEVADILLAWARHEALILGQTTVYPDVDAARPMLGQMVQMLDDARELSKEGGQHGEVKSRVAEWIVGGTYPSEGTVFEGELS